MQVTVEGRAQNTTHLLFTRDSITPQAAASCIRVMALALFVSFLASIILAVLVIPVASFVPPRCTFLTANQVLSPLFALPTNPFTRQAMMIQIPTPTDPRFSFISCSVKMRLERV
jgi:hypothetical protein